MKELTQQEVNMVSGAGVIQDALGNAGSWVGGSLSDIFTSIGIDVPVVGDVSLVSILPGVGENIGLSLGGKIESAIASTPLIGSWLNRLLGN